MVQEFQQNQLKRYLVHYYLDLDFIQSGQTRGQQGIGITGVVMYSQLTTGKTTHVVSKIAKDATALKMDIGLDTKKNAAIVSNRERTHDFVDYNGIPVDHGLRIEAPMKAKFQRGKKSVGQYLQNDCNS